METAYIALGSNLGIREKNLRAAIFKLMTLRRTRLAGTSSFYDTEPVDAPPESGRFLNGVVAIETDLRPEELLTDLLRIERELGRDRAAPDAVRNAPREIDLDLLLYGNLQLQNETLTLPHPRMRERRFVLEPLAELAPDVIDPLTGRTARELLIMLNEREAKAAAAKGLRGFGGGGGLAH